MLELVDGSILRSPSSIDDIFARVDNSWEWLTVGDSCFCVGDGRIIDCVRRIGS